jgi:hypothetical protein
VDEAKIASSAKASSRGPMLERLVPSCSPAGLSRSVRSVGFCAGKCSWIVKLLDRQIRPGIVQCPDAAFGLLDLFGHAADKILNDECEFHDVAG